MVLGLRPRPVLVVLALGIAVRSPNVSARYYVCGVDGVGGFAVSQSVYLWLKKV